ncbi:hypothetical protein BUALT_Bualt01G0163600 [Buddleja alternifolia]|uniref:ATPase subunit 8 n=1 Tax=Buddleja alternifolia TaxID=168488 RepID=A0AAV6YBU9_9LAMI|nr:hypothetical protein BUALT_Bualt01G0163600 [Buddleja alternifolia]
MADLIHTPFRSPWTVMALLAITLLLCLTFFTNLFHHSSCEVNYLKPKNIDLLLYLDI